MLRVEESALVLLAAGRSSRFRDGRNKLEQELWGRPLGLHAALTLAALPFRTRIAVVGRGEVDYAAHGFRCVSNDDPAAGMGLSVSLGVAEAERAGAAAALVVLADMPCVTAAHVGRLFEAAEDERSVVASSDGRAAKPPALFGSGHFARLRELTGDAGARDLIRAGRHVVTATDELVDVDTPIELEALRAENGSMAEPGAQQRG